MKYRFWGWEHADAKAITAEYKGIETPVDLYDELSHVWCADTCAPRLNIPAYGEACEDEAPRYSYPPTAH